MIDRFPRKTFSGIEDNKGELCECGHGFNYHFESAEIKVRKGCIKCKCKKFAKSQKSEEKKND